MEMIEKLACIRLIWTRNIGPMTYSLLMRRYGSAHEALWAIPELARRGGQKLEPASPKLAGDLAKEGYVITSSLARGTDAATHRGALATGTIAVIAGGIDSC